MRGWTPNSRGLLYALGTVAGGGPPGPGRVGGGQVARRSRDAVRGAPALHPVSAWADEARLVLGQCRVDDKSNEIRAIPELLEMLVLEGGIVTIDAMGCYTRIAQTIRDRGAGYVLALKDNQPQLHEAVVETFAVEQAEAFEGCDHNFHQTVNKIHGRIETRRCRVIGTPAYIRYVDPDGLWPDLRSLVLIEVQQRQGDRVTSETRYYIPACRRRRSFCCRACAGKCPALGPGHGRPGGRKPHPHRHAAHNIMKRETGSKLSEP